MDKILDKETVYPIVLISEVYKFADIDNDTERYEKERIMNDAPIVKTKRFIKWSSIKDIMEASMQIREELDEYSNLYIIYTYENATIITKIDNIEEFTNKWLQAIQYYNLV
jgi:hypothetical protein